MIKISVRFLTSLLLLPFLLVGLACAQTAAPDRPGSLVVLNAHGASLQGKTLSLDGVSTSAIVFTDRPVRQAGFMRTSDLLKLWANGTFSKDPPNATVSAFAKDGSRLSDAVVVLKSPKLVTGPAGDRLTFDVAVLEGKLDGGDGPASIFIDTIWFGVGGDGVHYIGRNQTTGSTSPAFGSNNDTSNPKGWPNPAPDGTPSRPAAPPPPNAPPLSSPPANTR